MSRFNLSTIYPLLKKCRGCKRKRIATGFLCHYCGYNDVLDGKK